MSKRVVSGRHCFLVAGVLASALLAGTVRADTRCGTQLVSSGDNIDEVLATCGPPLLRSTEGPVLRSNGLPRKGAQKVDRVVYGPRGGAYQYMLFVNDELVRVDTRREAPGRPESTP